MSILISLLMSGCGSQPEASPLNVVILVLDGIRLDESFAEQTSSLTGEVGTAHLPRINSELLPQGTLIRPGYAHGLTLTGPGHCDLLTAHRQNFVNYTNPDGPGAYLPTLPTVFEALRASDSLDSSKTLLFGSSNLIEPLGESLYPGMTGGASFSINEHNAASDSAVLKQTRALITQWRPRLMLVNLHEIDRSGHYGTQSQYLENVASIDDEIMAFWDFLTALEDGESSTVLVLVSDHGRHRVEDEEAWHMHGDHCAGCRETVMFMAGPGIEQGVISTVPYALEDLGHTIASLLDTPMPYSQGILISEALTDKTGDQAIVGEIRPAIDGSLSAWEERTDDPAARAQVHIEGLSLPEAVAAEAPRVSSGPLADFACYRELVLAPGDDWMPWIGRCFRRAADGEWSDIGFPDEVVWPLFSPALVADNDGGLWLAYVDNPGGLIEAVASVRLLHWGEDTGWTEDSPPYIQATAPSEPALLLTDTGPLLALAGSASGEDGRNTRRIDLIKLHEGSWEVLQQLTPAELGVGRLEKPALWQDGDTIRLAFLSHTDAPKSSIWLTEYSDGSWSAAQPLEQTGRVLGHVPPQFTAAGEAVWTRLGLTGLIEVCRADESASTCSSTEAPYLDGLTLREGGAVVSVRDDSGPWARVEIPW